MALNYEYMCIYLHVELPKGFKVQKLTLKVDLKAL